MLAGTASAVLALSAGTCSSATISIPSSAEGVCCSTSDEPDFQSDPSKTARSGAAAVQKPDRFRMASLGDGRKDDPVTLDESAVGRAALTITGESAGTSVAVASSSLRDPVAPQSGIEPADNSPETVSSVAAPEPSALTQLLISVGDLRARLIGGR
jgi:hypothetical protein